MTNKFKIGDKVIVIGGFKCGSVGFVSDIDRYEYSEDEIYVSIPGETIYTFTESDLKSACFTGTITGHTAAGEINILTGPFHKARQNVNVLTLLGNETPADYCFSDLVYRLSCGALEPLEDPLGVIE